MKRRTITPQKTRSPGRRRSRLGLPSVQVGLRHAFAGLWSVSSLLVACLLVIAGLAHAQTLKDANRSYSQGQYARAAEEYRTLLAHDPQNAALHFNLGDALFKQASADSLGRAIAEYWRAYRIDPRDSDTRFNLDFALKKSGESLVPPGMPGTLHFLFHLLSDGELAGLALLGYWLTLLAAAAYWLRPQLRAKMRAGLGVPGAITRQVPRERSYTLLAVLAALWLLTAAWWGLLRTGGIAHPGVILEANAEARSGPGMNFPVSFNAPEGRRVSILSEQDDWLEVGVIKEGLRGWVQAKTVEKI